MLPSGSVTKIGYGRKRILPPRNELRPRDGRDLQTGKPEMPKRRVATTCGMSVPNLRDTIHESRTKALVLVQLLLAAAVGYSVDVTVTYVDGTAEAGSGGSWTRIATGDTVDSAATVRVASRSYVELVAPQGTIRLSAAGTYPLAPLVSRLNAPATGGIVRALAESLDVLGRGGERETTLSGVRSANVPTDGLFDWAQSDSEVYLKDAEGSLAAHRYDEAVGQLQSALDYAAPEELPQIRYYLAYAYALSNDMHDALEQAKLVTFTGRELWVPDFVLLKGQLLVFTNAYREAATWLGDNQDAINFTDQERTVLFEYLLGLAYRGDGQTGKAKAALQKAADASPETAMGKSARELVADM